MFTNLNHQVLQLDVKSLSLEMWHCTYFILLCAVRVVVNVLVLFGASSVVKITLDFAHALRAHVCHLACVVACMHCQ